MQHMHEDSLIIVPVKVVPRAARDEVVGWYGDHLKVRVAAAPEAGRANAAVEALLAEALDVGRRCVTIVSGHTAARKRVAIRGLALADIERRFAKGRS